MNVVLKNCCTESLAVANYCWPFVLIGFYFVFEFVNVYLQILLQSSVCLPYFFLKIISLSHSIPHAAVDHTCLSCWCGQRLLKTPDRGHGVSLPAGGAVVPVALGARCVLVLCGAGS